MDHRALVETHETVRKANPFRWLAGALIVLFMMAPVGIYAWRYLINPCEVDAVKEASTYLTTQLNFYDRVYQVAVTASRSAPDHPVLTLQQIFMDTQELSVPACMQRAKKELVNYMGTVILAFDAYRTGKAETVVVDLIKQSDAQYADFKAEVKSVNRCAPLCIR